MLHAGEVNVLPGNIQLRQLLQSVFLQLLGECKVVLGRKDLDRNLCCVDVGLLDQRRVGHRDSVDELGVGTELEACPCSVAVPNSDDLLVLLLQGLSVLLDSRPADLLVVASDEGHKIEVLSLLGVGQGTGVNDFAIEAANYQSIALPAFFD